MEKETKDALTGALLWTGITVGIPLALVGIYNGGVVIRNHVVFSRNAKRIWRNLNPHGRNTMRLAWIQSNKSEEALAEALYIECELGGIATIGWKITATKRLDDYRMVIKKMRKYLETPMELE